VVSSGLEAMRWLAFREGIKRVRLNNIPLISNCEVNQNRNNPGHRPERW
jgi:hypothetical protein